MEHLAGKCAGEEIVLVCCLVWSLVRDYAQRVSSIKDYSATVLRTCHSGEGWNPLTTEAISLAFFRSIGVPAFARMTKRFSYS